MFVAAVRGHTHDNERQTTQQKHYNICLMIMQQPNGTVGVILNLPTTKSVDLDVSNANIPSSTASLLMRYGANYVVFGE